MSFTSVFGGDTIDPSYLSYAAYETAVDITLQWPFEADSDANVMAAKLDIEATASGVDITFPDATQVSVGRDVLIKNTGATTFTVKSATGTTLGTVASGIAWYFYLIDNSTEGGTWTAIQFGAGTSSASAASLAGYGLEAVTTLLQQDIAINPESGNYAPGVADRASVILGTGGVTTYAPISAVTLGNGWFVWVINGGTGALTWTPGGGQTVDGAATKVLAPMESAIFFSDGANFWTAAYGRSIVSTVTTAAISVTAAVSPLTLTATQAAAQIQDYNGTLGGNLIVNYGASAGFWMVFNNTSGAYSLTLRVNGGDPGAVIPQGYYSIIRSNGSNLDIAFTDLGGTVTSVATSADLTGGPITTTGTIGMADTTVTPAAYGAAASVATFTVSAKGRLTAAATVAIAIALSQVTAFSSADLRGRLTDETGGGLAVFNDAPALINPTMTTQAVGTSNTTGASTAFVQAATAKVYIQTFPATGTYTPHAGMVNCIIETIGGGGGGGGNQDPAPTVGRGGGGGGAGSRSVLLATAATIGASQAVTIGVAGAAGASGNNAGGAGGDTSVGVLCIGKGGSGGAGSDGSAAAVSAGGAGGVAGTGTITPPGEAGWGVGVYTGSAPPGGNGGSSLYGAGGRGGAGLVASTGGAASGFGAGGGGAASYNATGAAAGGAGTAGYVVITEFCNQ